MVTVVLSSPTSCRLGIQRTIHVYWHYEVGPPQSFELKWVLFELRNSPAQILTLRASPLCCFTVPELQNLFLDIKVFILVGLFWLGILFCANFELRINSFADSYPRRYKYLFSTSLSF